jgi:hypothetical protein
MPHIPPAVEPLIDQEGRRPVGLTPSGSSLPESEARPDRDSHQEVVAVVDTVVSAIEEAGDQLTVCSR